MKKMVLCLVVLVTLLCGCGRKEEEPASGSISFEYLTWYEANPEQKNVFSTEQQLIQKDLITDGIVSTEWKISSGDLKKVKKLIEEYAPVILNEQAMEYVNSLETYSVVYPEQHIVFSYCMNGENFSIDVTNSFLANLKKNCPGYELTLFLQELEIILYEQKEYKSLPETEGGYM